MWTWIVATIVAQASMSSMTWDRLDLRWRGSAAGDRFGSALEIVDFDGDRTPEVIVGAPAAADDEGNPTGTVEVFSHRGGHLLHRLSGERG